MHGGLVRGRIFGWALISSSILAWTLESSVLKEERNEKQGQKRYSRLRV